MAEEGRLMPDCRQPILVQSPSDSHPAPAQKAGWTPMLILASIITTIGSALPVGYNIGVINTPAHIIQQFCNVSAEAHYGANLSPTQLDFLWSTIVSIFLIGGMVGSLSGGWLADRFGRKGSIVVNTVINLTAAVLFLCCKWANSLEMLLLARLVVGFSSGLATSVVPMYLTELSPIHLRGALGVCCPLGVCLGVLVGQFMGLDWLLGTEQHWNLLLALFGVLVLICALLLPVLPESPKYLYIVRGMESRGIQELSRIRRMPEDFLGSEIRALRHAQKSEQESASGAATGSQWGAYRVLKSRELRLPLILVCAMQAGQQFSGINAVFYYSTSVFQSAGLSPEVSQYANLGAGLVNFGVSALAIPLVNNCGRRPLMLFSTATATFFLALLGVSITYSESSSWLPYVAVTSVLLYVFFYGVGMGPIPYFIGSELFDVGPRPIGMAVGSMANWAGNFVVGMTFTAMHSAIHAASFYVFAVFTVALGILIKLYFPETKGRDPAEVADMLKLGFKSRINEANSLPSATPPSP